MLGGHFMEIVPLGVQMECFVDMACRSYLHFELCDCHWTLSNCNISITKVLSSLLRWIVGVKRKFGESLSSHFLVFASFEKDFPLKLSLVSLWEHVGGVATFLGD